MNRQDVAAVLEIVAACPRPDQCGPDQLAILRRLLGAAGTPRRRNG